MRVAYLSTDSGIRLGAAKGAAVHVTEMVEALAAEGNDVLLLVAGIDDMPHVGVKVESLPGEVSASSVADRIAFQPQLAEWLARRLATFEPDVLYERVALYSDAGARAARKLRIPHIVELNSPLREEAARFRVLEAPEAADEFEASTLRAADVVLAVSPPLAEFARTRGARRVEVFPNAAAIDKYKRVSEQGAAARAVFAGSLRPWHGLETIARAWQILGSAAPPLLIVGDGPSRAAIADVRAEFTGAVEAASVPGLLASAGIGLAPYGRDTPRYFSPIKLFEYLAAGLATVVGDLPAVTSVVDATSAVVIPAGDAAALAEAVARLAVDADYRRLLGRNGRELVATRHTWRHRAQRVEALSTELAVARAAA